MSAAALIGAGFVGVDLLPAAESYVVLELNGAVEFDRGYDLGDSNVFAAAAAALGLPHIALPPRPRAQHGQPREPIEGSNLRERAICA